MTSRRKFLAGAAATALPAVAAPPAEQACPTGNISLDGSWRFRLDADSAWKEVEVPHTWQTAAETAEYYGVAWYERAFAARKEWSSGVVRVEFEAVFHSATVWVNDKPAGQHLGKGYTAFALDVTPHLRFGARNTIRVRVDNAFNDAMLPRGKSSDWTHDGGIYRPVHLRITPKVFIERVEIDAEPDLASGAAHVRTRVLVHNGGAAAAHGSLSLGVLEAGASAANYRARPGETVTVAPPPLAIEHAQLWHFDHLHLYQLEAQLSSGHQLTETFGIRKIEARNGGFYLNGERVRLMGVERMAGSNPEFGMAEPSAWIEHDHADMKELNCVYTRVHWQQDRRVLDWCDRHGIFIQTEVPTWGGGTFRGMENEPSQTIMENGLEQLREMIARDRNHPSVFSWGVCNEIGGQRPAPAAFARRMYAEAKRLDPQRLVTYASNSLEKTPEKDVAGEMDYVMWNEYYETWYKGTPADMAGNLEAIHQAFPDKAIVISEYGYCACTPDRPERDGRRIEILTEHDRVFHDHEYVAGLIFFCYNDYRTHVGDKGAGVMKHRVHGVVDLYGNRKPSYDVLRRESSPVEALVVTGTPSAFQATVRARGSVPGYTLGGYKVRAVAYGTADVPIERFEAGLPSLARGQPVTVLVAFQEPAPIRVQFDILRPTGFSACTLIWRP
jgi:beta-glucuronidase